RRYLLHRCARRQPQHMVRRSDLRRHETDSRPDTAESTPLARVFLLTWQWLRRCAPLLESRLDFGDAPRDEADRVVGDPPGGLLRQPAALPHVQRKDDAGGAASSLILAGKRDEIAFLQTLEPQDVEIL